MVSLKFDLTDLKSLPNRFERDYFDNYAMVAGERTGQRGENAVKDSITKKELLRTGNMRNSTVHTSAVRQGRNIKFEIITGAPVSTFSLYDQKTGKMLKTISIPSDYADHVERRFAYMASVLPMIQRIHEQEQQLALNAWSQKENRK